MRQRKFSAGSLVSSVSQAYDTKYDGHLSGVTLMRSCDNHYLSKCDFVTLYLFYGINYMFTDVLFAMKAIPMLLLGLD